MLAVVLLRDKVWHLGASQLCSLWHLAQLAGFWMPKAPPSPNPELLSGRLVPSFCWGQKLRGGFTHTLVCVFDSNSAGFQSDTKC